MSLNSVSLPAGYGYVVLSCVVGPFITSNVLGAKVMAAREKFSVPYPNLYATPGFHKEADSFNRVQRGHQNMLEVVWFFVPAAIIGGLKHPFAVAVEGVLFCVGCFLYQSGYSNKDLDVNKARHLRGGPIKYIGLFGVMGAAISAAGSLNKWW